MAEAKYDLLLVTTKTDKKIYEQPWYKERLHTRYIKSLGPNDTSKFLQGKNWTFVKDGLDDFRDGLPPPIEGGEIIKGSKGLAPVIQGSSDDLSTVKQPAASRRFTKDQICYSTVMPLQQQRRTHIEEIEYGLKQHPLALYPHLEECMPPDVFEDVVDILDPEMNLASEEDDESYVEEEQTEEASTTNQTREENSREEHSAEGEIKIKNPYKWLPRREDNTDKRDKKKANERRSSSPSQDEHIKGVTKDFCDWVESLGGESNNIEESTIMSLFASGYETKPALSVPIHVVELTNVPPELRMSASVPQQSQSNTQNIPSHQHKQKQWTFSGSYEPSWVKFKYGAWYLNPKSWERRDAEEPLMDPKELKDQEMSEAKKKANALDSELAPMHGAKSFMEFIDNKNNRRPEFLDRVRELQEKAAREEQAALEAEALAKRRAEVIKARKAAAK